jgi:hypothetical protein
VLGSDLSVLFFYVKRAGLLLLLLAFRGTRKFFDLREFSHVSKLENLLGKLSGEESEKSLVLDLAKHLGEDFAILILFAGIFHLLVFLVFAPFLGCSFNLFALTEYCFDNLNNSVECLHVGLGASLLNDLLDDSTAFTGLLVSLLSLLFLFLCFVELVLVFCQLSLAFRHLFGLDAELSVVVVQVGIFAADLHI